MIVISGFVFKGVWIWYDEESDDDRDLFVCCSFVLNEFTTTDFEVFVEGECDVALAWELTLFLFVVKKLSLDCFKLQFLMDELDVDIQRLSCSYP